KAAGLVRHAAPPLAHLQRMRHAEQRQRLAAHAEQQRRLRHASPFLELGGDPAPLVVQEGLDLAPRRAERRDDLQAVRVDAEAERAPPPPREAVFDGAAAELDYANAFCCASIHSFASALISCGLRLPGSIAGPMRTVTVPGRLRKALRGQQCPALCA